MRVFLFLLAFTGHWLVNSAASAQSYSPEAISNLRFMIEEEKLAGDVYRVFGALYPTIKPFQNIPRSEDDHVARLVGQANLAGISVTDLTSLQAGQYQNQQLQLLYGSLIAQGSTSSFAALTVGKNIELMDIDDLNAARALVPSTSSLYATYGILLNASNNHLNAFNHWLSMTPAPTAPVPEPETYAMFLMGLGLMSAIARHKKNT